MSYRICLAAVGRPRLVVSISPEETLADLYSKAEEEFGLCQLKSGFPPSPLENSANVVAQSVVSPNDRVTVILASSKAQRGDAKKKPRLVKGAHPEAGGENVPSSQRRSKRAAAKAATEAFSDVIKAQDKLQREDAMKRKRASEAARSRRVQPRSSSSSNKLKSLPGRRLGDGAAVGPVGRRRGKNSGVMKNESDVSFALMNAIENGGGGKVGQVLRGAMRNAITRQYDASRAVSRVSAVHAGKYSLEEKNGSLHVSFDKGLEGRGQYEEIVDYIPRAALEAVISAIHASDPESLRAPTLSQLSPRVFWSTIHEMNGEVSIDQALQRMMPSLDWSFLRRRKQVLSAKAKENLRQERLANGEKEEDLARAQDAVEAVEQAMDQLHQYDRRRRRNRAAEAASARLSVSWKLETPDEEDDDELRECAQESRHVENLLRLGIKNWRQLANASAPELVSRLGGDSDVSVVEGWIDRAQQESIVEIATEICDNKPEVVEVLRDEARSGTPKDLANWKNMPDMLYRSAPSLAALGISENDVAQWCERATCVLTEWEWTNWYATPVE